MSVPMKTRRTDVVQITVGADKKTLYLVPKDKAESIESLLEAYRFEDSVPGEVVFHDLYARYGKVGTSVRGLRAREDLTQAELAKKIGCPQSWISGWESGKRPLGKKSAQKLARIFKVDYRVFL